jgi:hypothetical protein
LHVTRTLSCQLAGKVAQANGNEQTRKHQKAERRLSCALLEQAWFSIVRIPNDSKSGSSRSPPTRRQVAGREESFAECSLLPVLCQACCLGYLTPSSQQCCELSSSTDYLM